MKPLLKSKETQIHDGVTFDDIRLTEASEIANSFNHYFVESVNNIVTEIQSSDSFNLSDDVSSSSFSKIDMKELKKYVMLLKKTSGPDGITTNIFKDAFDVMRNRLLDLVNTSLEYGTLPEMWKISTVTPIQKVPNTKKCEAFRSIHPLPICEKVLELVVRDQLLTFSRENNILIDNQSGFREHHSCESSLVNICHEWLKEFDTNKIVLPCTGCFPRF